MPEATEQSESHRPGSRRVLAVAVGAVTALSLGVWAMVAASPAPSPPDSTSAASTTAPSTIPPATSVTAATTTAVRLTEQFSPFVRDNLVSRTGPIPDNPAYDGAAAAFYVDPVDGDDGADGSLVAPVATLEAAQALARRVLRTASGDVVVYLRGGIHQRSDRFTLTFQDSGRDGSRMIYRSYPGEQAIVDGGVLIPEWESAFGSVLVAAVPDEVGDMRQFYAAGNRQARARSDEASYRAVDFVKGPLFGRQRNVAMTVDSAIINQFTKPEELELVYVGVAISGHGMLDARGAEELRPSWKSHRLPVSAVEDLGNGLTRVDIGNGALYHASERGYAPLEILPSDPFYLENALELLDEPGEWYFDSEDRLLYWWPPDEAATADAWVPTVDVLLDLNGTPGRQIRNVSIEGIAFRHTAYLPPTTDGYVVSQAASWFAGWEEADWMTFGGNRHPFLDRDRPQGLPGAAVQLDSARDITFSGNVFSHLGAVGVMVHNDVRRSTFDANLFSDISAAALVAGHPEHDEIDEPMEGPIAELHFTNNVVDRAAAEFYASVGVQITKTAGAEISHNLFRDLPYTALSLGWGWENNPKSTVHRAIAVENNYFENVVNLLYDGAPVYLLGPVAEVGADREDFVQIRGNFINNAAATPQFKAPGDTVDPDYAKRPGIQVDRGSMNILVVDNVFAGTTDWIQVTAYRVNRKVAGWAERLALETRRNWSDNPASEPADLGVLGAEEAIPLRLEDIPEDALDIISNAGLDEGVVIPPLP